MSDLTVQVDLGPRSYEIAIVSDQLAPLARHVERWLQRHSNRAPGAGKALIITDRNVAVPHAATVRRSFDDAGWTCDLAELEPGEQSKRLDVAAGMYDRLVEMQADRQTLVVAVGGGVVGDLAGFVAATYARGIGFVQVPTTLLAHVDSSVGGKVAVNHPRGKNLIGAFYQPLGVLIDTATLDTLPEREYRSGLGEVVKYGVILDAEFFEYFEKNVDGLNARDSDVMREVIARCCQLKADVVEQDECEQTGVRAVLNYGHTFAHAFEVLSSYAQLQHGEAVSIGMIYASRLAEKMELIDSSVTQRQIGLLQSLGIATKLTAASEFSADEVLDRMQLDKKTVAGRLRFVLPTKMGHVEVFRDVPLDHVRAVLDTGTAS